MITAVRAVLLCGGIGLGWYGIGTLLGFPTPALISVVVWFAGGILLHDAVFAPLAAIAGIGGRRLLPVRWWGPAACGAVCTVALSAIAVPVIARHGARPLNHTILDRPYAAGLAGALVVVWALVALAVLAGRIRRRPESGAGS
ncbi:hypothetical protein [Nocardia aurantia]|uniref:Uncharacterized protein n=1 Tax=Nocardia aurantia TaxID=2585199 RepID=A0A7K0DM84_9NOCA|nr:hypothetical protein [Nocardia aurantia]MQY26771.1 hypothetical protein [Nocardia aurantia]